MNIHKVITIFGFIFVVFAASIFYKNTVEQENQKSPTATVHGHRFNLEIATTPEEQQKGLSDRDSLPQDNGMLFVFPQSSLLTFWMKDMGFPIDIIFIHGDTVVSIAHDAPPPTSENKNNLPLYKPDQPSDKVLEINAGLAEKYGMTKGDRVEIEL